MHRAPVVKRVALMIRAFAGTTSGAIGDPVNQVAWRIEPGARRVLAKKSSIA
jgi:hypothetical protein